MRLWPTGRRLKVWFALGALVVLLVVVDQIWILWDRQITISQQTTHITAPLDGGYPDYLAALNTAHREGTTPENNAAILVADAAGLGDLPPEYVREMYKIWGVAPSGVPSISMEYSKWLEKQGISVPGPGQEGPVEFDGIQAPQYQDVADWEETTVREHPWAAAQHPNLARWVAAMSPALTKLEEACARPRFYVPMVTKSGDSKGAAEANIMLVLLPAYGNIRTLANTLTTRALMRLEAGDAAGYARDVTACLRLARLLAQQPTLIEHLVAVAIDNMAMRAAQAGAASSRLSPADAAALRREIETFGPMPTPVHAIDEGERYMILDVICTVHANKVEGDVSKGIRKIGMLVPLNYNRALERANEAIDRTIRSWELPDYKSRSAGLAVLDEESEAMKASGFASKVAHLEDIFRQIYFLDGHGRINDLCTANLEEWDLARIALGLRASRANGKSYPEKLEELKDIAVPMDQFTGQPLIYHRKGNGYLLYSLGINLKDDGGARGKSVDKGDIAVECAE